MILLDSTPQTEAELLRRARALAGRRLDEIAAALRVDVPGSLRSDKGWVGRLIETALGATAGNQALPDFVELGVELKTIPVDATGKPLESTYICVADLTPDETLRWADSLAWCKLRRVLWVPILAEGRPPPAERIVGRAVLWSPDPYELALLEADWSLHMRAIAAGAVEHVSGSEGAVLQVRPKAANRRILTETVDEFGEPALTNPRGFYLRASFTRDVILNGLAKG